MHKGRGKSCGRPQIGKVSVGWCSGCGVGGMVARGSVEAARVPARVEDEPAASAAFPLSLTAAPVRGLGRNIPVLSVFTRPLVKAGRSVVHISCFSIAEFL